MVTLYHYAVVLFIIMDTHRCLSHLTGSLAETAGCACAETDLSWVPVVMWYNIESSPTPHSSDSGIQGLCNDSQYMA